MKNKNMLFVFLVILLSSQLHYANQRETDSLKSVLLRAPEDTNKVNTLEELCDRLWKSGQFEEAKTYAASALQLSNDLKYNKGRVRIYNLIGSINLGSGNYSEALKYYFEALKIAEQTSSQRAIGIGHFNIGNIYFQQDDYEKTLKHTYEALEIFRKIDYKKGIASSLNSLATVFAETKQYDKSLEHYFASLKIKEEVGDKRGVANTLSNIGENMTRLGRYKEALKHYTEALEIFEAIEDDRGIANTHVYIGMHWKIRKDYPSARNHFLSALEHSKNLGMKTVIMNSYYGLAKTDSATGNFKSALENQKLYVTYRDSLLNEENIKKSVQTEMQYEFDKKESEAKALQAKKDAIADEEKRRQEIVLWCVAAGLFLVSLFSLFVLRAFRQKKKANIEISHQKQIIEEKQKEILDSIYYARRIQRALITSEKYIGKNISRLMRR